ncbi:MAG: cbb3-type cytochrome oxidase assembly protein CcoS [Bacteroidetes bacterium]|nr:cbb3-type cytochrome oxidase assembly protein CcoS [Bacteroidota bacterium]
MSAMVVLLCASLLVALIFLFAFIWSVRNGQYDDEYSPAHKILFEENENQSHN